MSEHTCAWTCRACGTERGRADEWMDDHHPAGSRVMYCADCDAARWHHPPEDHAERYPGDPYPA